MVIGGVKQTSAQPFNPYTNIPIALAPPSSVPSADRGDISKEKAVSVNWPPSPTDFGFSPSDKDKKHFWKWWNNVPDPDYAVPYEYEKEVEE